MTRERSTGSAQRFDVRHSLTPDHARNGTASTNDTGQTATLAAPNISPVNVVLSASRHE